MPDTNSKDSHLVVYEKSTCSKCRETIALLDKKNMAYEVVEYHITPLTHKKLAELIQKMGITPKELFRTREDIYKKLKLKDKQLQDDEYIDLMIKYPDLMERPIVERGDRAVLARPPERVKELL